MKVCRECGEDLVVGENWSKDKVKANANICRPCSTIKVKEWRKKNPDRMKKLSRKSQLKTKYGITEEDYDSMYEFQGGCCDICGRHQTEFQSRLAVDHDHETGAVRSLLCGPCNMSIGLLGDDIATVREALNYLIKYSEEE